MNLRNFHSSRRMTRRSSTCSSALLMVLPKRRNNLYISILPGVLSVASVHQRLWMARRALLMAGAGLGAEGAVKPDHFKHLEDTAREEREGDFIEGPFLSEAAVSDHLGHNLWGVIRRFVLVQGTEGKLRPIDDALECQLNSAYSTTIHLQLQDTDFVTALALEISKRVCQGRQRRGSGRWVGKCLDLSKAYKQLPVHPSHRDLAVIFQRGAPCFT